MLIVLLVLLGAPRRADATTAVPPAEAHPNSTSKHTKKKKPKRRVSVLFSPFYAFVPMFDLMTEVRIKDEFSVGLVVAAGASELSWYGSTRYAIVSAVPQFRYYFVGDFQHGLNAFMKAGPLGVYDDDETAYYLNAGAGLGYKVISRSGFSAELLAGMQIFAGDESLMVPWLPMLNARLGWSF